MGGLGASEQTASGGALVVPHRVLSAPPISCRPSPGWRCPKLTFPSPDRLGDTGLKLTLSLATSGQPVFLPSSLSTSGGLICLGTWATLAGCLQPRLTSQPFPIGVLGSSPLFSMCFLIPPEGFSVSNGDVKGGSPIKTI